VSTAATTFFVVLGVYLFLGLVLHILWGYFNPGHQELYDNSRRPPAALVSALWGVTLPIIIMVTLGDVARTKGKERAHRRHMAAKERQKTDP
jgi:hypothetical protein